MALTTKNNIKQSGIKLIVLCFLLITIITLTSINVNAGIFSSKDLTFTLDQSAYYFLTGENAIINLSIDNSYSQTIEGQLYYTLTQSIQKSGQFSSSQIFSFPIEEDENIYPLDFGTSSTPVTLFVDLKYTYKIDGEARFVEMDQIAINFVDDESQKNNQQNKQESSSQESNEQQNQNNNNQNNNQQSSSMQQLQQNLQNNQLSQDTAALQKQIQNQIQEEQELQEQFQNEINNNQDFQNAEKELLDQGYSLDSSNLNPESSDTGNFEMNYQDQNGNQASISGQMTNGDIDNLQTDSWQTREDMLEQLQQDPKFQKYQDQLEKSGFNQTGQDFNFDQNSSSLELNYSNLDNQSAKITAEFSNGTLQDVQMTNEKTQERNKSIAKLIIGILSLSLILYGLKKLKQYLNHKKKRKSVKPIQKIVPQNKFDYKKASLDLIKKAKEEFAKKEYKDAYGSAAASIRLYLSYENNLNKEITNDEVISFLKKHGKEYKDVKESFDLASLVEFAKYEANQKDFDRIIKIAKKVTEVK